VVSFSAQTALGEKPTAIPWTRPLPSPWASGHPCAQEVASHHSGHHRQRHQAFRLYARKRAGIGVTSMGGVPYLVGCYLHRASPLSPRACAPTPGGHIGLAQPLSGQRHQDLLGSGFKLSDEQEEKIEDLILGGKLPDMVPAPQDMGRAYRLEDAAGRYIVFLKNTFPGPSPWRAEDSPRHRERGHVQSGPGRVQRVGRRSHRDPQHAERPQHQRELRLAAHGDLRKAVVENGAAIGLAFDGDGDRLIAVDEKGVEITGDQIMIICANMLKAEGRLKNDLLVSTIMSNMGLSVACKKYGFKNHAAKVGDRYVLEDMQRLGGVIGGEESVT